MVRAVSVALGVGLILLWIVGLAVGATEWMTWLDGIAGLLLFLNAAQVGEGSGWLRSSAGPGLVGAGLAAMWIVGLATHADAWLSWWTFAFAGGLELFAASAAFERLLPPPFEGPTEA